MRSTTRSRRSASVTSTCRSRPRASGRRSGTRGTRADENAPEERMDSQQKILVVRNGTLIDGSGRPPIPNEALVIEDHRIRSVGRLPASIALEDTTQVEVIDATGQWIMP